MMSRCLGALAHFIRTPDSGERWWVAMFLLKGETTISKLNLTRIWMIVHMMLVAWKHFICVLALEYNGNFSKFVRKLYVVATKYCFRLCSIILHSSQSLSMSLISLLHMALQCDTKSVCWVTLFSSSLALIDWPSAGWSRNEKPPVFCLQPINNP